MALDLSALIKDKEKPRLNLTSLFPKKDVGFFEPMAGKVRIRDVVREIGNTVKDIGQEVARNIGSAGVTISSLITGEEEVEIPKSLQFIFKKDPIKSIELRVVETEEKVKKWGETTGKGTVIGSIAKNNPTALAFAGIMGSVGLDLTPLGGRAKTITKLKRINNIGDAITTLSKMGVSDDLAKFFAADVVKTKTDNAAKKLLTHIADVQKETRVLRPQTTIPTVVAGDNFTLRPSVIPEPLTLKELKTQNKLSIKATREEIKKADAALTKAQRLAKRQQKTRLDTIQNINRYGGTTENITQKLKSRHLLDEDIANIVLEDGTKLTDAYKVKRNTDKSLASVILKSDIDNLKSSYKGVIPDKKWVKAGDFSGLSKIPGGYELPYIWFSRKGLNKLFDPIIEAGRASEILLKNDFLKKFKDAGLYKEGGWFTSSGFQLSKQDAEMVGKYYLTRQKKGYNTFFKDLSDEAKKFVNIFDDIIKKTEDRFFEVAKKNGKTPNKVEKYAPIMTRSDIKLADEGGTMDFIFRKHPSFFSVKERAKKVPVDLYEIDYREVASRWLSGISDFLTIGDVTPDLKYLIDSDAFKSIVTKDDYQYIYNWLRDVTATKLPTKLSEKGVYTLSKLLRKGIALGSLGLNYASVAKQALTQIPLSVIEKAPPKLKSQYAKAFNINVADMPSITKRRGDIAIADLQGRIGRIFTGLLSEFDRKNAQLSLNALLDKGYNKFLKEGIEITPEIRGIIEKTAQDKLDVWYGGFFKGQRPEFFRSELGNFINMFIYPLTSQLNGFYGNILKARGVGGNIKAAAEVATAATVIAYLEKSIENMSLEWSDKKEMTKDVLQSLLGNIPIVSQISYSLMNEREIQISPGIAGISNLSKKISQYFAEEKEGLDVFFAAAEVAGLPKQVRRAWEGIEIINEGGLRDKNGKMLAPVKEADEIMRSFLRGKYGSMAAKDWIKNIGKKKRRWFTSEVEFLQNGDYDRKAQLYITFPPTKQKELRSFLSEAQQKKLDKALSEIGSEEKSLKDIFKQGRKQSLEEIFSR